MAAAKLEDERLEKIVASQKVTMANKTQLLSELDSLRSQIEVVDEINAGSQRNLKNREQYVSTAKNRVNVFFIFIFSSCDC